MQSATFRAVATSTRHHDMDIVASDHAVQSDMSASTDRLMEKLATTASSRDDDDMKGSDSWKLHSDTSTASSRVTTPDPQPPPISRPSLSSRTTETHTPHASRTPAIPIPGPCRHRPLLPVIATLNTPNSLISLAKFLSFPSTSLQSQILVQMRKRISCRNPFLCQMASALIELLRPPCRMLFLRRQGSLRKN
ncbi:hypothetical protein J3459_010453 [Metarhizium acridum]|nr:hypothetical protein J3459_010453 [Metarhizium acridum]